MSELADRLFKPFVAPIHEGWVGAPLFSSH
jgi:hypothetical protein